MKKKIYVGCPIQGLPVDQWEAMKARVAALKESLVGRGYEVLNFRSDANRQAPPGSVFEWDFKQCLDCDAMIAIALHPSTGMGMEIMSCLLRPGRRGPAFVFATAPVGNNTSRMVTDCNLPGFYYEEFGEWENIPDLFETNWSLRGKEGDTTTIPHTEKC